MKITGTTWGEILGPAMEIAEQAKADEYFEALVQLNMERFGKSREEAERTQKSNLGYYAGYYSDETRKRVERLFKCSHPVFGAIAQGKPTPDKAFQKGVELGQTLKRQ